MNLQELYGELALSAMAEKAGDTREEKIRQLVKAVSDVAEVKEHPKLKEHHGKRSEIEGAVRDGVFKAIQRFEDESPFKKLFRLVEPVQSVPQDSSITAAVVQAATASTDKAIATSATPPTPLPPPTKETPQETPQEIALKIAPKIWEPWRLSDESLIPSRQEKLALAS
jgi:hypothetical protein